MHDPQTTDRTLDATTLVAYHRGELGDDERRAVQMRLAGDPAAVRLLLDLDAGLERTAAPVTATPSATALGDDDVASAWSRFEAAVAGDDERREATPGILPFVRPNRSEPRRRVWTQHALAIAATLAMAVLGLAGATLWMQVDSGDGQTAGHEVMRTAPEDEAIDQETTLIAGFGADEATSGWVTVGNRNDDTGTSLFAESFETAALPATEPSPAHEARGEIFDSSFRQHELDGWSTVVGAN